MTISYSDTFFKLLLRWKGSLWKSIWKMLFTFLVLYYSVNMLYRHKLNREQIKTFQKYIILFDRYTEQIPLTFLLGFFVAMVIGRWWQQFQYISWPDSFMYTVSAYLRGDGATRVMRRTIARYCILTSVLAWRSVSVRVFKRFPTEQHLLSSGLMTKNEYELFKRTNVEIDPHKKWFIPLNWIQSMLVTCHQDGRFEHTNELRKLLDELDAMRNGYFQLFLYDWVTIPLVYTQVATISVFGYFAMCLIGRQYPKPVKGLQAGPVDDGSVEDGSVDLYIPVFTILQFLFYVGWLKVGEDLMFPFGSDDEDFEFNYILDRNLEMAYLISDQLHMEMPSAEDRGTDDKPNLLHTQASAHLAMHKQKKHLDKEHIVPDEMDIAQGHDPYEKPVRSKQSIFSKKVVTIKQPSSENNSIADDHYASSHSMLPQVVTVPTLIRKPPIEQHRNPSPIEPPPPIVTANAVANFVSPPPPPTPLPSPPVRRPPLPRPQSHEIMLPSRQTPSLVKVNRTSSQTGPHAPPSFSPVSHGGSLPPLPQAVPLGAVQRQPTLGDLTASNRRTISTAGMRRKQSVPVKRPNT